MLPIDIRNELSLDFNNGMNFHWVEDGNSRWLKFALVHELQSLLKDKLGMLL